MDTLDSDFLIGCEQLVVEIDRKIKSTIPSMGLVLYSTIPNNSYKRGHELATLLFKTTNRRKRKRSILDNEVEDKDKHIKGDLKRKKKKKKGSKGSKLKVIYNN